MVGFSDTTSGDPDRVPLVSARTWRPAGFLLVLAAGLAGCSGGSTGDAPIELAPQARPTIADVPLPDGFSFDETRSRSHNAGGGRYVDYTWTGRKDKYDVMRFYEKYMTANQWTRMQESINTGEIFLDFDKANERCAVMISRESWLHPTRIRIVLSQVGRIDGTPR